MSRLRRIDRDVAVAMGWVLAPNIAGMPVYTKPSSKKAEPYRMAVCEWAPLTDHLQAAEFAQFVRDRVGWRVFRRFLAREIWPDHHDPIIEHEMDLQPDWDFESAWGSTPEQICRAGLNAIRNGSLPAHDVISQDTDEEC